MKTKPYAKITVKLATLSWLCLTTTMAFADASGSLTEQRRAELTHLVKQDCGSCHGMTLKGGLGTPLQAEDLKHYSVDFITATIIYGRPQTAMPGWSAILTKQEARWIAQQLKEGSFQ